MTRWCRFTVTGLVLVTLGSLVPSLHAKPASMLTRAARACPGSSAASDPATDASRMHCLVRFVRRSAGVRPLRASRALGHATQMRAQAIVSCGEFSHDPCGQSFMAPFSAVHYLRRGGMVGENLAWGDARLGTPLATLTAWLRSPEHRRNLLGPWREDAIAVVFVPRMFGASDVTLWVMQFGRR